jgi:DNA polymerase elongation subunit (family B)
MHTDAFNVSEVMSKGYENVLLLVTRTIDKIMTGDIKLQNLVFSKSLGQGLDKYKSLFPHVSAAIQLANQGKPTMIGTLTQTISCTTMINTSPNTAFIQ